MSNKGEVTDIGQLPITSISYGPLSFEQEQVKVVVGPLVCQPSENGFSVRELIHIQILQSLKSIAKTLTQKVTQVKLDFETELVEVKETLQENNGLLGNLTTKMTENSGKIQQNQVSLQSSIDKTLTETRGISILGEVRNVEI